MIKGINYFYAFKSRSALEICQDLDGIKAMGADWVALCLPLTQEAWNIGTPYIPYATDVGQMNVTIPHQLEPSLWHHYPMENFIAYFIEQAKLRNLKVMFKPHVHPKRSGVSIDGTDVNLPQSITPRLNDWFNRWEFILCSYANSHNFDGICVGTELAGLFAENRRWQNLVISLRSLTQFRWNRVPLLTAAFDWWAPLLNSRRWPIFFAKMFGQTVRIFRGLVSQSGFTPVYAPGAEYALANNLLSEVPSWMGALDYIGVNAYFPLSGAITPTVSELTSAWRYYRLPNPTLGVSYLNFIAELTAWSVAYKKPLLVTEIGYVDADAPAKFPQNWMAPGGTNAIAQSNCYQAALKELSPITAGMFLWNWTEPKFVSPQSQAMRVVKEMWSDLT